MAEPISSTVPTAEASPGVAAVVELPDGRELVVLDDGREVVRGRARPYAHPVPGCEWLGAHRSRPRSPRPPRPRRRPPSVQTRRASLILPDAPETLRARALLESLLTPSQLRDWRASRGFWVDTPRGPVRLGHLYELLFRPYHEPTIERILCVVPEHHRDLPIEDTWSNLLLVLAVEPDEFFRVAVRRGTRRAQRE